MDGKYFTIESENDGNIEAKCMKCREIKKGNYLSTGNFLSHYKLKHPSDVDDLRKYTKPKSDKTAENQPKLHDVLVSSNENVIRSL